ncbi:hypothetical protein DPMN_062390 [Dreissena polymorpha]|uniref:Uncharacterized protein n=1 Tax=Dreissena polymorpha TaxID=45954 RepID=A0A9D4HJC0_DREPO|nr:hypothetical protein DPMN_062390 [Dreissena polymorpha]
METQVAVRKPEGRSKDARGRQKLLRTQAHGDHFEHAQKSCRSPAFYCILLRMLKARRRDAVVVVGT